MQLVEATERLTRAECEIARLGANATAQS